MGFCQVHTRIVLWVMLAFLKESGGAHIYKFGLAAGGAIAEMHPFADCYGFFISYVINVFGGFGVKKDFCESA